MPKLYRRGRRRAFEALFEAEFARCPARAALERGFADRRVPAAEAEYARRLVAGVCEQRAQLDLRIHEVAPARPVAQLPLVDRTLLRIALYELLFNNAAVPTAAVINDAVELAKRYGSDSSRRLVNGVLGTISRSLGAPAGGPPPETEAPRGSV